MRDDPQRMASLGEAEATALEDPVQRVEVRDDEPARALVEPAYGRMEEAPDLTPAGPAAPERKTRR